MSKRRPNPVAWGVLFAVVAVLFFAGRACAGGDAYSEPALALARESAQLGAAVAGLPARIDSLDRQQLFAEVRGWRADAEGHLVRSEELEPRSVHRRAHGYLTATLGLRAEALRRYEPALRNALSDGDIQVAVAQVAGVMRDFEASDRVYELFRAAWPDGGRAPVDGGWVGDDTAVTVEGVRAFVGQLREQPALEEIYNLAVLSLSVDPKPTGKEREVDLLPFTRSLGVTVVVENDGNQPIPASPLSAVLTSETDPRPRSVEGRVEALRPGQKATVTLTGLTATPGGPVNLLRVTVGPVAGERNLLDNSFEYKFVMGRP